ncbi:MAG TPA: leucyl aminopeptidase family protein [Rhodobacteraceae bacterium]|nr:leucyl aminopeptidase family protein [Paracoccaceae bacterium]
MQPKFTTAETTIPIYVVKTKGLEQTLSQLDDAARRWVESNGFAAKLGQVALIPAEDGGIRAVLAGWGDAAARARGWFNFASIAAKLPEGGYRIEDGLKRADLKEAALAWLLAGYRFDKYASQPAQKARLACPLGVNATRVELEAEATFLTRDLINTPANDMGPEALGAVFFDLAKQHKAKASAIVGDDLLRENFGLIHAVGRAAVEAPRLLDMIWGDPDAPKLTLVGKGVCFDTGGLNIKPGASMGLMKKDMGGAANVLGLAHMIMSLGLPVRLRVLIPAVENSISASAFRPQDILRSRKGLTVENNNTDAEGRLVLADALAMADEETPDMLICMATLTGAARVALGPDLPPFYTDDSALAHQITRAARAEADPLWRMPFWEGYEANIEPGIADLNNAPAGGMAGSINAALFLRRFVENAKQFAHFDIYGWTPAARPARPKGGEAQGGRAILAMIEAQFNAE